jgi:uncharacterized membrane protein
MAQPTDQELDITVAGMLRFGVSLAAAVVFAGGVLLLRHPWSAIPDYTHFQACGPALRTLRGIVHGAIRLDPKSIIQLGLVLLIATPVARVVYCIVGFARQRDRFYVLVSSIVLAVLIYSLTYGR